MRVIGIADTADQGFYPQWTPGLIWVQHGLLAQVEPNPSETQEIVGLRLYDSSTVATGQVVQTIWNLYNGSGENSAVERYSTWQQVKDSMASNDRLLGLLLALFGIIALVAAPCAIANVTAGRVLVQRQDIAMLKALGFTPGQVVRMLLAEQTLLGAAGAGARADRRPDHHLAAVRPAAGRHAGGPRAAVRRLDGADRRGHRAHRRDRHRHPGLVGGPGVAGRRRPAEPAPRPPVADRPAQPALPPARRAGARGQGLADPAAVRRADRVRPGHPDGDDHDRADLLVDHRRRSPATRAGSASPRPVTVSQGGLDGQADAGPDRPATTRCSRPIPAPSSSPCCPATTAPSSPGPWAPRPGPTRSRPCRGGCSTRPTRRSPARASST